MRRLRPRADPPSPAAIRQLEDSLLERLLLKDPLVLVVDKPAGLPVHPGPGGGLTLEHGLEALRFGLPDRPQLAHRLDRDTSGCLVLGRSPRALAKLGKLFQTRRPQKRYWAIVRGAPPAESGLCDLPLARKDATDRAWRMVPDPAEGQPTATEWQILTESAGMSLVEFRPLTGRTHQIRVHAEALGCPIWGDTLYGGPEARIGASRLMLHARAITLPFSHTQIVSATAPVPAEFPDWAQPEE